MKNGAEGRFTTNKKSKSTKIMKFICKVNFIILLLSKLSSNLRTILYRFDEIFNSVFGSFKIRIAKTNNNNNKILMEPLNVSLNRVDLKIVVCGLYTLLENDGFFKKINFKKDVAFNVSKKDYFSSNSENFYEFKMLLNNSSLRHFAFRLLKPLLNKKNSSRSIQDKKVMQNEFYQEVILLKKYLRKFKYNYYRFFYFQNISPSYSITEKGTNTAAIKFLFLLVGI